MREIVTNHGLKRAVCLHVLTALALLCSSFSPNSAVASKLGPLPEFALASNSVPQGQGGTDDQPDEATPQDTEETLTQIPLETLTEAAVNKSLDLKEDYYSQLSAYYSQIDPRYRPELDLMITQSGRTRRPRTDVVNAPDGFPDQIITGNKSNLSARFTAEVPLMLSGPERFNSKLDKWSYARNKMSYLLEREDVVQEVASLYYRVTLGRQRAEVLGRLHNLQEESVSWYEKRIAEGRELGFRLKEAQYLSSRITYDKRVNDLETRRALKRLEELTGMRLQRSWFNSEPELSEFELDPQRKMVRESVHAKLGSDAPQLGDKLTNDELSDSLSYSWLIPTVTLRGGIQNRGDFSRFETDKVIGDVSLTAHFHLWEPEGSGEKNDLARLRERQLQIINNRRSLVSELTDSWYDLLKDSHWLHEVYPAQKEWLEDERRVVKLRYTEGYDSFEMKQLKRRQALELELTRIDRLASGLRNQTGLEYWLENDLSRLTATGEKQDG